MQDTHNTLEQMEKDALLFNRVLTQGGVDTVGVCIDYEKLKQNRKVLRVLIDKPEETACIVKSFQDYTIEVELVGTPVFAFPQ